MQIIKLHIGLIKFIIKELPKKKTKKELIDFFKSITKAYFKELFRLYKNIFLLVDKDYQLKKKQFNDMNKLKGDLQRCLKMLQYVDTKMEKSGINRQRRRQFWRDFFKDGQVRKDIFDDLLKEINQI